MSENKQEENLKLEELLEEVNEENKHPICFPNDEPRGKEIW